MNSITSITPKVNLKDKALKSDVILNKKGKYDQMSIDNGHEEVSDSLFLQNIKNKVLNDIKNSANTEKLHKLKNDIYSGEYHTSSEEIIRKIMLGL